MWRIWRATAVAVINTTQADGEDGAQRNGGAGRICPHGVDADVDGVPPVVLRRKAVRGDGKGEGNGAESLSAAGPDAGTDGSAEEDRTILPRCSMVRWRCSNEAEIEQESRAIDTDGAGVESHEGGGGEDQVCGRQRRIASST